jgi:SnoaL-like domain
VSSFPIEGLGVPDPATIADKVAIAELIQLERLWRDTGEWDDVAACYVEDAVIRTSWFEGSPGDFAEQSKAMADKGRHGKHPLTIVYVLVDGDRALVESRSVIQNRLPVGAVMVDMEQYVRFVSRVARTEKGWRLVSFEGIYEKGRIAPVDPNETVPITWADVEAIVPRPAYQLHAWGMALRGYSIPDDLLGDDRPEERSAFYAAELDWLAGRGGA